MSLSVTRTCADGEELIAPPLIPVSAKKDSNEENARAYAKKELKHEPPTFKFIAAANTREIHPVYIKEVKLPKAKQTHEVCYEPVTQCVFVSQMTSCVLVRIPIDQDGFLHDDQDAWQVGKVDATDGKKGIEGIHNISLSPKHPGCLWISLQYSNQLLLVDVTEGMRVKQIFQVPTVFNDPVTGLPTYVGGPHCIRESPLTGDIWVALKGALKDAPCSKASKIRSACCDPVQQEASMNELSKLHGCETPIPDGWAVWRVTPSMYDPQAGAAKGGTLYKCLKSPPMLDFDAHGKCYVPQDASDTMLVIDSKLEATRDAANIGSSSMIDATSISTPGRCKAEAAGQQLKIPWPFSPRGDHATGPAVGTAPDGSIWMSQLGSYNALVRIAPNHYDSDEDERVLYEFGGPPWCKKIRLIHLAFSPKEVAREPAVGQDGELDGADGSPAKHDEYNRIYALSSDLLDDEALNAVVILRFDDTWTKCLARRIIPLPTQDCACHRIVFIDTAQGACEGEHSQLPGRELSSRSIVITELASSKLLQIKVRNLHDMMPLEELEYTDSNGFKVRKYRASEDGALEGASV